ncbi:hypothetical protein D9M69_706690 [compost metagenome]
MARPIKAQAAKRWTVELAWLNAASPAANTRLLAIRIGRPPERSMSRPAKGPMPAATSSATEKAPKTVDVEMPMSLPMAPASTAGR